MKRSRVFCAVFLWLVVFHPVLVCAQELVRGFSYWEMCYQLRSSAETAEALEVSPSQRSRLEQACSQLSREGLFEEVEERLRLIDKTGTRSRHSRPEIFMEANKEVHATIAQILTPGQLENLFPVMLHAKYPTGYAPFRDRNLFKALNVPTSVIPDDFQERLEAAIEKHSQDVARARLESAKKILADLTEEEKQRFVNWAGNVGLPNYTADTTDTDSTKMQVIYSGSVRRILDSKEVQHKYQITAAQLKKLQEIVSKYREGMSEFSNPNLKKMEISLAKQHDQLLAEVNNSANQVLTAQQRANYCRDISWNLFLDDFRYPFSSDVVIAYLRLDKQRQSKLLANASVARDDFFMSHGKIDRQIFESLCQEFPVESRSRFLELFKRAWDMPINPKVGWNAEWN